MLNLMDHMILCLFVYTESFCCFVSGEGENVNSPRLQETAQGYRIWRHRWRKQFAVPNTWTTRTLTPTLHRHSAFVRLIQVNIGRAALCDTMACRHELHTRLPARNCDCEHGTCSLFLLCMFVFLKTIPYVYSFQFPEQTHLSLRRTWSV